MGLLDKWWFTKVYCGKEVTVEKIKIDQNNIRQRLDNARATLNGEEGWFLSLQKSGGKEA